MTPLQIEILLWYHARMCDFRDGDLTAPAVRDAVDEFRDRADMLAPNPHAGTNNDYRSYRLTDRGEAFVNAILSLPLPICRWEIPSSTVTSGERMT